MGYGVWGMGYRVLGLVHSPYGVVLEHVGHVIGGDKGIVDSDHLDVVALQSRAHHL